MSLFPSGARAYLQGPGGTIPASEASSASPSSAAPCGRSWTRSSGTSREGRKAAIYAARDRFYRGDIGQRIAAAVQDAGGLMTAADLASYRGRVERPTRLTLQARATHTYDICKTGFWGQGPVLLQTLRSSRASTSSAWATTRPSTSTR